MPLIVHVHYEAVTVVESDIVEVVGAIDMLFWLRRRGKGGVGKGRRREEEREDVKGVMGNSREKGV